MRKFRRWLTGINRSYDKLPEPNRFIVAMAMMIPGFALIAFNPTHHPALFFFGVMYLMVMFICRTVDNWKWLKF